jgi:Domain of unknown function (DUF4573)
MTSLIEIANALISAGITRDFCEKSSLNEIRMIQVFKKYNITVEKYENFQQMISSMEDDTEIIDCNSMKTFMASEWKDVMVGRVVEPLEMGHMVEPLDMGHMVEPLDMGYVVEPLEMGHVVEPLDMSHMVEPFEMGHMVEPLDMGHVMEPLDMGHVMEPLVMGHMVEPLDMGHVVEHVVGFI